ncbi:RES domain-containing protein [Lederbergia galactosidilytica]|uniref:RES domain-containing protein n=1 Tax=Lederbergia galactosidilytica TaxID=217031 RepID=UPI0007DAF4D9|nr:RES domain-containing protein [Lederbergia galactosidilytica]
MQCCEKCFQDPIILKRIHSFEEIGECDYCKNSDVFVIAVEELADLFEIIYKMYSKTTAYEHFHPEFHTDYPYGELLIDLVNEDWNIFSASIEGSQIDNDLLFDILQSKRSQFDDILDYPDKDEQYSRNEDSLIYEDPLHYLKSDWDAFSKEIKGENRFLNKNADRIFVGIEGILKKKEKTIDLSIPFFRGRIGKFGKEEMFGPPPGKGSAGRANPKGISYLYCATNRDTCCAELRPWKSATITICEFFPKEQLHLVDISNGAITSPFELNDQDDVNQISQFLWLLSNQLSVPVSPDNAEIDYLPTQYLVELIKSFEYDGVIFKSSLGNGNNIVLFDERKLTANRTWEVKITDINYSIEDDFDL